MRKIRSKAMPGWLRIRKPTPTDSITTEGGDDLLAEDGTTLKKES